MAKWHFSVFHVWVVHMGNRYLTRSVRVFKEFVTQMARGFFRRYRLDTNVGEGGHLAGKGALVRRLARAKGWRDLARNSALWLHE